MPVILGAIVGSLIFTYLWSRLWLWLIKRFAAGTRRVLIAFGAAWITSIILGAFGFADGGPPDWIRALVSYTPGFALWLVIDLLANRGRKNVAGVGTVN